MLNFSKGYTNQNNVDTNKYAKLGRKTPEEIKMEMLRLKYQNVNKPKEKEEKVTKQKNNGADLYNRLHIYRNIDK